MAELRSPQIRRAEADFVRPECSEMRAKTKDPSGGTTGRVKLYGRLGGWALAPNTASMGRDNRSHIYWSRKGRRTFKCSCRFFNFLAGIFDGKLLRGGAIGFASGLLVGR